MSLSEHFHCVDEHKKQVANRDKILTKLNDLCMTKPRMYLILNFWTPTIITFVNKKNYHHPIKWILINKNLSVHCSFP